MIYEYDLKDPEGNVLVSSTVNINTDDQRQLMKRIYKDLDAKGILRRFWFKKKEENVFKSLTGFSLILRKVDGQLSNVLELAQNIS